VSRDVLSGSRTETARGASPQIAGRSGSPHELGTTANENSGSGFPTRAGQNLTHLSSLEVLKTTSRAAPVPFFSPFVAFPEFVGSTSASDPWS